MDFADSSNGSLRKIRGIATSGFALLTMTCFFDSLKSRTKVRDFLYRHLFRAWEVSQVLQVIEADLDGPHFRQQICAFAAVGEDVQG